MTDTNELEQKSRSGLSDLTVKLAAAVKSYGEYCYEYGLANPLNFAQRNRQYGLKIEAWNKVEDVIAELKAPNANITGG